MKNMRRKHSERVTIDFNQTLTPCRFPDSMFELHEFSVGNEGVSVTLDDVSASWTCDKEKMVLSNITFTVK